MDDHVSLDACNSQDTVHPDHPGCAGVFNGVIAQDESDRGMSCRAERLKKVRVLKTDATIQRANRNLESCALYRWQSVTSRSREIFECCLSADIHLPGRACEVADVRGSREPHLILQFRRDGINAAETGLVGARRYGNTKSEQCRPIAEHEVRLTEIS